MDTTSEEKIVYLVRHGQTRGNQTFTHQSDTIPLSARGLSQAHALAEVFETLPIDVIITSDLFRAKETALIASSGRWSVEATDLFREIRRPSSLIGKSFFDPRSMFIMGLVYVHASNDAWHWSDEESVHDTYARAGEALAYLASRPEKHMVVVTHRGFIAAMLALIKYRGHGTVRQFLYAGRHSMGIGNASITTLSWQDAPCEDDALTNDCWRIVSVNDRTHLR